MYPRGMKAALPYLTVVVLLLCFASLLISRRRGDRFQAAFLLCVATLSLTTYLGSGFAYGWSRDEWIGVTISAMAAAMAGFFLRRARQ